MPKSLLVVPERGAMKIIIAGSRDFHVSNAQIHEALVRRGWAGVITHVVCGMARGIDKCGKWYGDERGIPVLQRPANWVRYGPAAGSIRNQLMAEEADGLLAFWNGASSGTSDMILKMIRCKKPVFLIPLSSLGSEAR